MKVGVIGDRTTGMINSASFEGSVEGFDNPVATGLGEPEVVTTTSSQPTSTEVEHRGNGRARQQMKEEEEGDDDLTCGWGRCRPKFIQCCNNPIGFLVFVSIFAFVQGMTVNGLVYVVTTTLERRFNIPSVQSGFISSCYDFGVLLVVAFVTYFGEKAHKPVWLGVGAFVFAVGSLLFSIPHFTTGQYQFDSADLPTCRLNGTLIDECSLGEPGLNRYLAVFVVAQLLHGVSASGLYTLGFSFLDENSPADRASIYIGIFQAMSLLGPACGYLVGGALLGLYTDLEVDTSDFQIDSESPLWIGAWWLGFLITASLAFLVAFPLLAFPRSLPGHKKDPEQEVSQAQKGVEFKKRSGLKNGVKDFPKACWCLIKNPSFMFLSLAAVTEWFLLTSLATFGPKYLETQFSMTASDAALLAGYLIIPSSLIGTLLGGVIVSKMNLQFRGMMRFGLGSLVFSAVMVPAFIISCPNPRFAGVTVHYTNTSLIANDDQPLLNATCNAGCNCGSDFDPVCGSDDILYYTPCHAGCNIINTTSEEKSYSDCSCIQPSEPGGLSYAVAGKCSATNCHLQTVFIVIFFLMLTSSFLAVVPVVMATMRCVAYDQRSFALGFQSMLYRAFGTIPSPVVFGALIDRTCILWENDCSGGRLCWQYDNATFSRTALILTVVLRALSVIFFTLSLCLYRPGTNGEEVEEVNGSEKVKGVENDKKDLSQKEAEMNGTVIIREVENGYDTKL